MPIAPLANVFAYADVEPHRLAGVASALQDSDRFDVVWHPAPGWVAATKALPYGEPDRPTERAAGLAFVEGRHRALSGSTPEAVAAELQEGRYQSADDVGVAWFGAGGRGIAARSLAGLVPFYVWTGRGSTAVSSLLENLVRFLPAPLELDPLTCGLWLGHRASFPDGRSFFRNVTVLAPGSVAALRPGEVHRLHRSSPWPDEPAPWPSRRARRDHIVAFREAVVEALDEALPDDQRSLLTLSGGLDSSLLAVVVSALLGRRFAALSLIPEPGHPLEARERSSVEEVVHECGISPHIVEGLSSARRLEFLDAAPAVAHPVLHPALHLLPAVARKTGARVLVGGEFADEVCGGSFARPDWLFAMTPLLLARLAWSRSLAPREARSWAGWLRRGRRLSEPWPAELPAFVIEGVRAEYAEWRSRQVSRLRGSRAPHRHIRALLDSLAGVLTMNWEVCSALGIRRSFPFLTAGVLRVVAACHPAEMIGPGPKRLERQAFADVVPPDILSRPKGGGFGRTRGDDERLDAPTTPDGLRPIVVCSPGQLSVQEVLGLSALCRFVAHTTHSGRQLRE